jgi:hypothetical protein
MEIRNRTLEYYETFTERDLDGDRRQGRQDAENDRPEVTDVDFSAHERDILARTRHDLSSYAAEYQETRNRQVADRDAKQQKVDAYNGERDNYLKAQRAEIETLANRKGEGSSHYNQLKNDSEEATDRLKSLRKSLGRPLQSYLGKIFYFFVFAVLAIAEIPINLPAAQEVFRESPFTAFIITAAIGLILIFLASYLGQRVRQWRFHTGNDHLFRHRLWFWLGIFGVLFLSGLLVWGIYFMRIHYMEGRGHNSIGDSSLFFLIINIGIYVTEFIFSLLYHDPDPDYQQAFLDSQRFGKKFAAVRNAYEAEREAVLRRHNAALQELDSEHERMRQDIATIEMNLANLDRFRQRSVNLVLDVMGRRITAYQEDNARVRDRKKIQHPVYFGADAVEKRKRTLREEFFQTVS